jgi:outer membrane protein assembly factor BamA
VPAVVKPYNPLLTLQPRKYSVQITPGNFGEASIITASGSDVAGIHSISIQEMTEWKHPVVEGNISYNYGRLPVDLGISVFRQITPATTYQFGSNNLQWIQESVGATTALGYSMPRAFDSQNFNLSYSFARVGGQLPPVPAAVLNPYNTPSIPSRSTLGSVHFGWSYSNADSYLWSVGPENGIAVGATLDLSDPALASDSSGYAATIGFGTYFKMPWLRHHALALHASGGFAADNRGGRGPFYVGGFIDLPVVDTVRNTLIQGGVELRGYPVVAEAGNYYGLFNAEYRFPILNVDRGMSTLPFFLNRISGAAFVDYGSAFSDPSTAEFKTGVGGELWFDLTLGYVVGFTFRAGFARGLASGGIDKAYFVAAVPF